MPRSALSIALVALLLPAAAQAETCRFTGTTSHDGHLSAKAETSQTGDVTTIDVTIAFTIDSWISAYRYLGEEITTWRSGDLQSIAVNQRSIADGSIVRQQWDVFTRHGPHLEASRLQAKYLADFRQRHPGFVAHWSPAAFGQPWLTDYARAAPERRPDLDLPAGTRTPLAFAFYWSRFLAADGGPVSLVLPSFKQNKTTALTLAPAIAGDGWLRWSSPLRHPALETAPASLAAAWVSPDHYLLQLGADIHTAWASGQAILHADGCQGVQVRPG